MIVAKAPLRISLGGGGTDLPFFSNLFGGNLTSVAINKHIYIIVAKREFYDDFVIRYSQIERVKNIEDIQHTRIKAALKYLEITDPLEITCISDVPAEMGLGSSSSFLVALLKALHAYKEEEVSAFNLAEEAAYIEMNTLGEPIGKQDQYLASFGGLINLDINKNGKVIVSPLDLSLSDLQKLEGNLLLFSTGITHCAADVISDQKKNMESDEEKMSQMHLIKEIGNEIKLALEKGDISKIGRWLNVHWEAKKKSSDKMSCNKIDSIYELGIKNGALGGKLIGAGGGGFLLFYCENKKDELRDAMKKEGLKELNFKFDHEGCKIIYQGK
jgi:D-glycero-alpha-D-manno-heptose-7-phosphate kinase